MDADYRGLAVVRSLGRHGIPCGTQARRSIARYNVRYNRRTLSWPSQDEEENVNFLVQLAERENIRDWLLFPTVTKVPPWLPVTIKRLANTFNLRPTMGCAEMVV